VSGELAVHWPESRGLLPPGFAREPDRVCVLALERDLDGGEEPPDSPGEIADAVTAVRLTTAAALAAGPVLFELLDGRPFGIRPVLPIAATAPPGEPSRLDGFRAPIAVDVLAALGDADGDPTLAEALDRWELSLFQPDVFRAEQLRTALAALLGNREGPWAAALRGAVLLGETPAERADLLARLRGRSPSPDAVRRTLVEVVLHGDRTALIEQLDESLLGLRTPPASYFTLRATG
jgi:hypothetical protein